MKPILSLAILNLWLNDKYTTLLITSPPEPLMILLLLVTFEGRAVGAGGCLPDFPVTWRCPVGEITVNSSCVVVKSVPVTSGCSVGGITVKSPCGVVNGDPALAVSDLV